MTNKKNSWAMGFYKLVGFVNIRVGLTWKPEGGLIFFKEGALKLEELFFYFYMKTSHL